MSKILNALSDYELIEKFYEVYHHFWNSNPDEIDINERPNLIDYYAELDKRGYWLDFNDKVRRPDEDLLPDWILERLNNSES